MAEGGKTGLIILLVILIIVLVGLVGAVIVWRYFLNPSKDKTTCTSDNQCSVGSTCVNGECQDIICNSDLDCGGSQICINTYCIEKTCTSNNDCSEYGEACSNGYCVPYGSSCNTPTDCNNGAIGCFSGVCGQCSSNSDCQKGYCNNGLCTNSCNGVCGQNQVCVANKNQACCDYDPSCGMNCNLTGTGSCSYCVNGVFTCKKGNTFEGCTTDQDCISNKCFIGTSKGDICGYVEASECVTNDQCNSQNPFCVKGTCNQSPLGALCGDNGNSCRTQNLNVSDVQDVTSTGTTYSYYCVDDFCRSDPGKLGEKCSVTQDCGYVQQATNSSLSRLQCVDGVCQ